MTKIRYRHPAPVRFAVHLLVGVLSLAHLLAGWFLLTGLFGVIVWLLVGVIALAAGSLMSELPMMLKGLVLLIVGAGGGVALSLYAIAVADNLKQWTNATLSER